jgi:hypothetical protein
LNFHSRYRLPADILKKLSKNRILKITHSIGCPPIECWLAADKPKS